MHEGKKWFLLEELTRILCGWGYYVHAPSMYLSIHMHIHGCTRPYIYLCMYPSTYLAIDASVHSSRCAVMHPSIHPSIHPCAHPACTYTLIYATIHPDIRLSIHVPMQPFMYASVPPCTHPPIYTSNRHSLTTYYMSDTSVFSDLISYQQKQLTTFFLLETFSSLGYQENTCSQFYS